MFLKPFRPLRESMLGVMAQDMELFTIAVSDISNTLLLQFGQFAHTGGEMIINFPTTFKTVINIVLSAGGLVAGYRDQEPTVHTITTTNFKVSYGLQTVWNCKYGVNWIAVGY